MTQQSSANHDQTPRDNATADEGDVESYPIIPAELNTLRDSIDNLDAALIHLLAERFKCTQRVGVLKAEYGLPAGDPAREERQIERLRTLALSAHLDPEFAEKLLNFIVSEVVRHHEAIRLEREGSLDPTAQSRLA